MQDFPTKSPSEEIPKQAANFSETPELFTWKFEEAVPSLKRLPTSRLIRKACIYMVSVKSFSSIDFYCLFNVGLNCLISKASAILRLNITWYTWYIISNVTFTFWKTWCNDYKCVIPRISNEKLVLTKKKFSLLSFFTLYHRDSSLIKSFITQS